MCSGVLILGEVLFVVGFVNGICNLYLLFKFEDILKLRNCKDFVIL